MDGAEEFIALYNELDQHLRISLRMDRPRCEFMDLISEAARRGLIKPAQVNELRDCKNIRNILVHTGRHPHEALAEPSEYGLERFRALVKAVCHPERVIPLFQRSVHVFSVEEEFRSALRTMAEHDFSQVVVRDGHSLALLSSLGVTAWLAAAGQNDAPDLAAATVADALAFEPPGSFALLSRGASLDDAWDAFEQARGSLGPRLQALIITEHGRDSEEPLGLVTPWDLVADGRDDD